MQKKSNLKYLLLFIPVIMAVFALKKYGFLFQSGSAGFGIILLLLTWKNRIFQAKDVWMILLAFLFSIGGDWFMTHKQDNTEMFIGGITLFFVAHIGYLSFALMNGKVKWLFTLVVLAGYLVFFFVKLFPAFNDNVLMSAALIYLLISCFSLGAAVGIRATPVVRWTFISGIFLVIFSDTIIALDEFVGYEKLNFLILPTYYAAHIIITFSLMKKSETNS